MIKPIRETMLENIEIRRIRITDFDETLKLIRSSYCEHHFEIYQKTLLTSIQLQAVVVFLTLSFFWIFSLCHFEGVLLLVMLEMLLFIHNRWMWHKVIKEEMLETDMWPNFACIYCNHEVNGFWVAVDKKLCTVVGTVAVYLPNTAAKEKPEVAENTNDCISLRRMYVLPKFRGSGVANMLLHTALDHLRLSRQKNHHDKKYVRLLTGSRYYAAKKFYTRNDFFLYGVYDLPWYCGLSYDTVETYRKLID